MFGLFKKPNAAKSAMDCLVGWQSLSDTDKKEMARAIAAFVDLLTQECDDAQSALERTLKVKYIALRQHNVRDKWHPTFIQFQIINDYLYSTAQGASVHKTCAEVLDHIISPLSLEKQKELRKKLERYT